MQKLSSVSYLFTSACLSRTNTVNPSSAFLMILPSVCPVKHTLFSVRLLGMTFLLVRSFSKTQRHQCKNQLLPIYPVPVLRSVQLMLLVIVQVKGRGGSST